MSLWEMKAHVFRIGIIIRILDDIDNVNIHISFSGELPEPG